LVTSIYIEDTYNSSITGNFIDVGADANRVWSAMTFIQSSGSSTHVVEVAQWLAENDLGESGLSEGV